MVSLSIAKPRHEFKIVYHGHGHVILWSQYRKGVSHALDRDDKGKWHCSCEQATIEKKHCKHLKWLEHKLNDNKNTQESD